MDRLYIQILRNKVVSRRDPQNIKKKQKKPAKFIKEKL